MGMLDMGVAAVGTTGMDVGDVIEAIGDVVGKSMTGRGCGWAWAWLGREFAWHSVPGILCLAGVWLTGVWLAGV